MVYSKAWLLSHAITEVAFEQVFYQALVIIITCTPSYVTFNGKNRSAEGRVSNQRVFLKSTFNELCPQLNVFACYGKTALENEK